MIRYIIFIFISALVVPISCDEVDEPYGNEVEIDEPTELTKKAVIFEFTGIHCPNCPEGHEAIHQIDSVYHGHVIPIAIHAGGFAVPGADEPDFRTDFGTQFFESLGQPGMPSVLFSSMSADDIIIGATTSWQGVVGNIIPDYTKTVIEPSFTLNGNQLKAEFMLTEREMVENNQLFYAFIIENHIEGPQVGTDQEPYQHMHVLRKCISNVSGVQVQFQEGEDVLEFETQINPLWQTENLYLVGIIVDQETKEIYTGEQISLTE